MNQKRIINDQFASRLLKLIIILDLMSQTAKKTMTPQS